MKWMMHRWWGEGGVDREWRVIESIFLRLPDMEFCATPRHAQTARDLGLAKQSDAETPWHYAQLRYPRVG